jgi:hypothetical protein
MVVALALVASSDGTSTATADMTVGTQIALAGQSDGVSDASGTLSFFVQEGLVSVVLIPYLHNKRERSRYVVKSR